MKGLSLSGTRVTMRKTRNINYNVSIHRTGESPTNLSSWNRKGASDDISPLLLCPTPVPCGEYGSTDCAKASAARSKTLPYKQIKGLVSLQILIPFPLCTLLSTRTRLHR